MKVLETNPVFNSVSLQQIDMLRYLLSTYHIPVREATKDPGFEIASYYTRQDIRSNANRECYGLKQCIKLRNVELFKVLWEEHYNAWDYLHLEAIIDCLKENMEFKEGIKFFVESYTTDLILNSLTPATFKATTKRLLDLPWLV